VNERTATTYLRVLVYGVAGAILVFLLINKEYRTQFLSGSGIAQGALIGAIALGVVLTYRGSGVVNFANGAIAMYVAYQYAVLRATGKFFLPPLPNPLKPIEGIFGVKMPNIPVALTIRNAGLAFWPALLISLGFCVLLGLGLHFVIFRPLRHAPPLAKVVASVGLFVFLQAAVIRRFNTTPQATPPLPTFKNTTQVHIPFNKWTLFTISADQLFVAVIVIVFAVALWLVFQYTRFGLATRAAAENEKGAVVLGFSPDFLAGTNWVLSTVITGLLGILVASTQTFVDPVGLVVLIVPALTAALLGSFSSFGRTTAAAFVLGMQVQVVQYISTKSWFPKSSATAWPGFEFLVPVVAIVLVLFLAGASLPTRGAITSGRLPFSPTPPKWSVRYGGPLLAIVIALAGLFFFSPLYRGALTETLIGAMICLSVVVITGFVGQISLAQLSFAGIAAYTVSKLSYEHGWPFPWPILVGAGAATLLGLVVALPALRVRGVNLAIITLAFAVAVDKVVFGNTSVTGGYVGPLVKTPSWIDPNNAGRYHFLGLTAGDGLQPNPMTGLFCLVVLVILCYLVANMRRSTTGRQMLAMRSNERAAAATGVNVSGTKILAFGVSAFIAGIAGGVIAYRTPGGVGADQFNYTASLVFFAFAYLGGISSVSGALAGGMLVPGGLLFIFLQDKLGVPSEMTLVLGGAGLVLSAILNPEGIAGGLARDGKRLLMRIRARARPPAPDEPVAVPVTTQGTA